MAAGRRRIRRLRFVHALYVGSAVTALLAASGADAQSVDTIRSGTFTDIEVWEAGIVPNVRTGGVILHNVEVAGSQSATRFIQVISTLSIKDSGGLTLSETFSVGGGGVVAIDSDNIGAIIVNPASGSSGRLSIGGCSNGRLTLARGGIQVFANEATGVGGQLRVGASSGSCPGDTFGTGILEITSAEGRITSQGLIVGNSGFDGVTGRPLGGNGRINILSGTLVTESSAFVSGNGQVDVTGDSSLWLLAERTTIEGKVSLLAGGNARAEGRGDFASLSIYAGDGAAELLVDGGASLLSVPVINVGASSGTSDPGVGRLSVTRSGDVRGDILSLSNGGVARFSGEGATGTFFDDPLKWTGQFRTFRGVEVSRGGVLEIVDGATVTAGPGAIARG